MKDKTILYTRVKPINKKYLQKMGLDTNNAVSTCLDAVLDAIRLKRDVKIKSKTNKILERAKVIQARHRQKRKSLTKF